MFGRKCVIKYRAVEGAVFELEPEIVEMDKCCSSCSIGLENSVPDEGDPYAIIGGGKPVSFCPDCGAKVVVKRLE